MTSIPPADLLEPSTAPVWRAAAALTAPDPAAVARIRRKNPDIPADVVSAIITQTTLRRQAQPQLGSVADQLLFTSAGAQQCTRPVVAARRARLLAAQGITSIRDLGCGIGVDSLACQRAGLTVVPVEQDPATAQLAEANLGIPVTVADVTSAELPEADATFVDPARREGDRRILNPDRWAPPWPWVIDYAGQHPRTVAKAAPGLPHEAINSDCAAEWISVSGQLVETCVWFPGLTDALPRRSAVLLRPGDDPWQPAIEQQLGSETHPAPAPLGQPNDWIVEPDPAIIRSHLIDVLAARINAVGLSPGIAYLTTASPPTESWGQLFRMLAEVPAGGKALKLELRRRNIGKIEVHTRGLGIDPARLRKSLGLSGKGPVHHLLLTRVAGSASGFLVEPQPPQPH